MKEKIIFIITIICLFVLLYAAFKTMKKQKEIELIRPIKEVYFDDLQTRNY